MLTGQKNGVLEIFDLETQKVSRELLQKEENKAQIMKIKAFNEEKQSNLFFSLNEENSLFLWDLRTKKQLNSWLLMRKDLVSFEIDEEYKTFYLGFESGIIQVKKAFFLI